MNCFQFYSLTLAELSLAPKPKIIPFRWITKWKEYGNEKNVIDRVKICFDAGSNFYPLEYNITNFCNKGRSEVYIIVSILISCFDDNRRFLRGTYWQGKSMADIMLECWTLTLNTVFLDAIHWPSFMEDYKRDYVIETLLKNPSAHAYIKSKIIDVFVSLPVVYILGIEYDTSIRLKSNADLEYALSYYKGTQFVLQLGCIADFDDPNIQYCMTQDYFVDIKNRKNVRKYLSILIENDCVWMWLIKKESYYTDFIREVNMVFINIGFKDRRIRKYLKKKSEATTEEKKFCIYDQDMVYYWGNRKMIADNIRRKMRIWEFIRYGSGERIDLDFVQWIEDYWRYGECLVL